MGERSTTLLVDPSSDGHHLQSVSWLTRHLAPSGPVVLLTRRGASEDPQRATLPQLLLACQRALL